MRVILAALFAVAIVLGGFSPLLQPRSEPPCLQSTTKLLHPSFTDLAYSNECAKQRLDLYLPASGARPFPLIIYVHGGGYARGTKESMPPRLCQEALARGYAVASVDYRLLRQAPFPAQIDDVISSIQWLRSNASTYSLDPNRVITWGFSAGGHLAVLAGTAGGRERLTGPRGVTWGRAPVSAVVDWAGPSNFYEMERYLEQTGQTGPREGGLAHMSGEVVSDPQLLEWAEPLAHADSEDPPVLIEHGDRDKTVPIRQARELAKGLRVEIGTSKVQLHVLHRVGHDLDGYATPENLANAFDWLDVTMKR